MLQGASCYTTIVALVVLTTTTFEGLRSAIVELRALLWTTNDGWCE
jgi:hypothetical protein